MNKMIEDVESLASKYLKAKFILPFLVVVTILYYGQSVFFQFLNFDDDQFISNNEIVTSNDHSFVDCFKYKFKEHDYFPLTFLVFRLLRVLFGLNPFFFHALNVTFHLINVILVFFLGLKVLKKLFPALKNPEGWASMVALLFSMNPVHVESVAWSIDLKDLLYTSFYLTGLLAYWKWLENGKMKVYLLSVLLAIGALLSKSTAITFIFLLFGIDWLNGVKAGKKMILSKIPFLLLTVGGFYIFGLLSDPQATLLGITGNAGTNFVPYYPDLIAGFPVVIQRIILSSFRLFFWFFHSLFPYKLSCLYSRRELLDLYELFLPALPILLLAAIFIAWRLRKKSPFLLSGFLFFLITISPALAKTDMGVSVFVPDRYMYLPLFGVLIMGVGFLIRLKQNEAVLIVLLFFVFWSFKTLTYLPAWKNSIKLYDYCLKTETDNEVALFNRGLSFLNENRMDESLNDFNRLIEKHPQTRNEKVFINRGLVLKERGEKEKAMADFNAALQLDPKNFIGLLNRGNLYMQLGEMDKARNDFSDAYDIDSANFVLNKNIASLYNRAGNHAVALQFANKCLMEQCDDLDLLKIKGVSLFFLGRNKDALVLFSKVVDIQQSDGTMWYLRSRSRFLEKDFKGAHEDLLKAKALNVKCDRAYAESLQDSFQKYALFNKK